MSPQNGLRTKLYMHVFFLCGMVKEQNETEFGMVKEQHETEFGVLRVVIFCGDILNARCVHTGGVCT